MSRDELKAYLESLPFEQVQFYCYDHAPRVWANCGNQPITDKAVLIEQILAAKFPAPTKTEKPSMNDNSTNKQTIQATEGSTITIHGEVVGRDKTTKIFNLISWQQLLLLLLLALLTWLLYLYGYPMYHWWSYRAKPDELLILLTNFEDNSTTSYDAAEVINEKLSAAIEERRAELPNVRLQRLHEAYKRDELTTVKEIGKSYSATMIIWGSYDDAGMYPRFTVIDEQKLDVLPENLDDKLVNLALPPDDFTFYLNRDLPNQMNYLTHFTLGQIFYFQRQYTPALTLFETGLAFAQTQEATKFQRSLAAIYFYMGVIWQAINHNNDQSLQDYTKAIELNPWYTQAYNNRGLAYADQMNYEQALKDYTKAIELDPQLAQAYNNRGIIYANQKNYEPALKDFNKTIELDPYDATAYYNRGLAYTDKKNYDPALKDYTKAIELYPQFAIAYNNRGLAYTDQKNYDQALKDYTKAIELYPQFTAAYNNRGNSYARLGNYSKAEIDFDKAIQLIPDDSQPYNQKCWWGSLLGQATKVLTVCDKAVELSDSDPGVRDSRGLARALTGDTDGAIADFKAYVAWSKENGEYEKSGKKREEWIKALQAGENPFDEQTLQALREE